MKVPQLQIVPSPRETEAMLAKGLKCFEAGALAEAESLFRRCLQAQPNIPMALRGLAAVQFQNGKREEAAKLLERAVALEPDNLDAWANLAAAQASLQRFDDACRSFQRAIELSPGRADLHYGLGRVLRRAGRLEDAVAELALAAASAPQEWKYERTLGDCLRALARPTEAAAAYRRAMGIDPSQTEIALALGSLYRQEGHFHRALAVYRRILRRHRDHAGVWFNMAAVLFDLDRLEEAIDAYRHALAIDPNLAEAHRYIGNILQKQGRNDEARASFAAAAAIEPDSPTVVADAFYRAYLDCDWDSVGRLREKADRDLRAALDEGHEPAMSAHAALFVYDDPALHRAIAVAQAQRVQRAIPADQIGGRRRLPESEGPLNIGYLSGDIGDHPVSHLTRGLFGAHDRNAVSVTLYAFGADDQSEYRRAIVDSVDRFVDVTTLNDRAVAQQIAADRIDILVDLNGQTGAARMGIPARRPAPLQAVWLGYPGTGGGDWADFIIADAFVAPPSEAHHYVERLCLLPHSYLVTDDRQPIAKGHLRRADMGLPEDGFVFASFNNSYKIGADLFDTWMRILGAVEDSVLWLPEFDAAIRERLTRAAHDRGIDPARLIFANRLPKEWHLKRIGLADLGLDTLAYNGHTTTADALWAGLPVLTATGRSFARRVSGSLLRAIGVPELITGDLAAYEAAAIALAKDRERLLGLRQRIEANRSTAPLFDTARFARNLEGAYRAMRRAQRDGESRTPILVREEDGDE